MESSSQSDFSFLFDIYKKSQDSYSPWIQRKEIASWGAVLFYAAIYSFLFKILLEKNEQTISTADFVSIILPIFILLITLSLVTFALVHSHFASIYFHTAYITAFTNKIFELKSKENSMDIDLDIDQTLGIPKFLVNNFQKRIKIIQPYQNECHPLKIVFHFWSFDWFRKKENRKRPPFGNHAKQEAAIYSLIIIFNIILLFPFVRILYQFLLG